HRLARVPSPWSSASASAFLFFARRSTFPWTSSRWSSWCAPLADLLLGLRDEGGPVESGAVARVVSSVAEQPGERRQDHQPQPADPALAQRLGLPPIRHSEDGALEDVAHPVRIAHAVARQAESRFKEFLLQQSWPELDDEVRLNVTRVPEVVRGPRRHCELLAGVELEIIAGHPKRGATGNYEEMGFLDWVNVRRADGAAWRDP